MKGFSKGHKKQFARYLESEYNDDYLEVSLFYLYVAYNI